MIKRIYFDVMILENDSDFDVEEVAEVLEDNGYIVLKAECENVISVKVEDEK